METKLKNYRKVCQPYNLLSKILLGYIVPQKDAERGKKNISALFLNLRKNLLPRAKKTCVYSTATLCIFTFG